MLGIIFANGFDRQALHNPESPEDWHKALKLPATYKMLGVCKDYFGRVPGSKILIVESEEIPTSPVGVTIVTPRYEMISLPGPFSTEDYRLTHFDFTV